MPLCQRLRTGFTLLEVLIVVIVIGILAAIVIPQMTGAAESAKVSKVLQVVDVTRTAVQAHYADTGQLATEFSNSASDDQRQLSVSQVIPNWKGPYLGHPLTDADNPYGGIVRIYESFNEGPAHPVGFDLIGRGTDTATGVGQYIAFTQVSETVAREIDAVIDRGIGGNWRATGRIEWSHNTLMVFLMDVLD